MKQFLFVLLVLLSTIAKSQDPNFHIYLCFGQSNMEGQGTIENQDRTVDDRFRVMGAVNCAGSRSFTLGTWYTATPPIFRCNTGIGPVDYFGRTMVANLPAAIKVGVVPVAVAGCDIALFDKVNYASYAATAPAYMQPIINQYGGNPYGRLVEVAKLAQRDGVIKGILFHQGETNSGQNTWPAKVKAVYDNLIRDLGLDPTKTPFLLGEVVTTAQGGLCGNHNSIIATVPNVIPNSYVISASGLPPVSDNLHFTTASYRTLGQRYAQKMLTLLPPTTNTPTVSITSPSNNTTVNVNSSITINATASVTGGTISKVEFFQGTTKIGEDLSSPYTFTWNNVPAGVYSLTTKATDNLSAVATSTAVSVTVSSGPPDGNMVTNPEFDLGTNGWDIQNNSGANGTMTVVTTANLSGENALKLCAANAGTLEWHVQVRQNAPITAGKNYTISFMAKADADRTMGVSIQQEGDPWTTHFGQTVNLTTASQTFSFNFAPSASDATSKLKFYSGNNTTCIYIDKVLFKETTEPPLTATITPVGSLSFCAGENVVLNANTGTGYTYQWKRNGANINTAAASSYTATAEGSYTVEIKQGAQTATSSAAVVTVITAPTIANAGTDQSVCAATASLSANTATEGSGMWTLISGAANITSTGSPTTGVTGLVAGASATLRWTISNGPCTASFDEVVITRVNTPTIADAGTNQNVCAATAMLAGNTAIVGKGIWTVVSGTATLGNPASPTSGISNLAEGTSVTLRWTISNSPCTASLDEVVITRVNAPSTADAGAEQNVCTATATLAANAPVIGTGMWTVVSGTANLINAGSPSSELTGLIAGASVTLKWTVTNAPCAASEDVVVITRSPEPGIAEAGPDQYISISSAAMAANAPSSGNGVWSLVSGTGTFSNAGSPSSTVTGLSAGANVFQWKISSGSCPFTTDEITIHVGAAPVTKNISGPVTSATGTAAIYSILQDPSSSFQWSVTGGATITGGNDTHSITVLFGSTPEIVTITVKETNAFGNAASNLVVTTGNAPVVTSINGPSSVEAGGQTYTYVVPQNPDPNTTYTWSVPPGAVIISGDDTHSVTVSFPSSTQSGDVGVTVSNTFGTATSSTMVTVNSVTAFHSGTSLLPYSLYPNPFSDELTIFVDSPSTERMLLRIIDMKGHIIYESDQHATNEKIFFGKELPRGIFMIHASSNGKQVTAKIEKF